MNELYCRWNDAQGQFEYSDNYLKNLFLIKRNSFIKFGFTRPGYIICKRFLNDIKNG